MATLAMRTPSVLMVTYQYAPVADGGAARQAQSLAEGLAQRGRRIGVVTARYPGTSSFERVRGVEVHRVWAIPRPGRFTATFIPSLTRFLMIHSRRYDIWHAHQAFYNAGVALSLARVFGKVCVVKDAASGPYGDLARLGRVRLGNFVRKALLRADAVISLNAEMTQELLAAGIDPTRIQRIPNGVDCEQFSPPSPEQRQQARADLGIPPGAALVLYAGRLAEDTGTRFIIEAWRIIEQRLPHEPWTLIVAGDELGAGEYRKRGERELRSARFVGKVPDVRPLLCAADVLVRPSLTEGMSNVVLEAMASGLPVVGTRTGGLREQIEDGVTGVLAAPGDSDGLANALVTLLRDEPRRLSMGSAGRKRVETGYSLTSVVDAYEDLYDRLGQNALRPPIKPGTSMTNLPVDKVGPQATSLQGDSRVEVSCVLCGRAESQLVAETRSLYSDEGFRIVRCPKCGLVYVNPRAGTFEKDYEDAGSAVAYFLAKESYDFHPRSPYHRVAAQIATLRPGAKVLDVGTGTGTFLEVMERHGLQGTGIEINRACVKYGVERRGRRLLQGSIERVTDLPPSWFDAATLIQTLEHVGNPVATLRAVRRYLKPGGLLYVDVPNYDFLLSRVERVLRSNLTRHWDPTAHLYYFTMRTLRLVVEAAGYRCTQTSTPAPAVIHRIPPTAFGRIADTLLTSIESGRIVRMFATS